MKLWGEILNFKRSQIAIKEITDVQSSHQPHIAEDRVVIWYEKKTGSQVFYMQLKSCLRVRI